MTLPKTSPNIVEIRSLTFSRGGHAVFDNISLDIPRGKVTAIMGPSGTGKTTLLRLISGQLIPDHGSVLVDGIQVPKCNKTNLATLRRKMGVLFQDGALFTDLNVFDNVAFLLREHTNLTREMIRDLVMLKLEAVGLRGAAYLKTSELSGGMSRRVALARAIMMDPMLMMYDEPFTGQDPINKAVLMKLIKELNQSLSLSSIVVSHDVEEIIEIADYLYVLADQRIIGQGEPRTLLENENPNVQQFMQGLPDGPVPFRYPARPLEQDLELGE